jgi:hypothetical protein
MATKGTGFQKSLCSSYRILEFYMRHLKLVEFYMKILKNTAEMLTCFLPITKAILAVALM